MKFFIILSYNLVLLSAIAYSQSEEKPRYAPRKEKHTNKTDELDRKQGLWKHYNMDGILMWQLEYLDDRKHGISRRYYYNGRIMRETEYQYGIRDGVYKRYNYDGVVSEGSYEDGKRSGNWTNYHSNGQVRSEGSYLYGLKEGVWKYYNRKGVMTHSITFKNGRNVAELEAAEKKAKAEKQKVLKKPVRVR